MSWELDKILKKQTGNKYETWDIYEIVASKKIPKSSIQGQKIYKSTNITPATLMRIQKTPQQAANAYIKELNSYVPKTSAYAKKPAQPKPSSGSLSSVW